MGVRVKKSIGKSGLAEVRLLKKGIIIRYEDGDAYELPLDAWDEERRPGPYLVTLSQSNDKILRVSPPAGTYIVQVNRFANRGTIDVPQTRIQRGGTYDRKDGKGKFTMSDRLVFDVELGVIDGFYEGLPINHSINYAFQPAPSGPFTDIVDTKTGLERIERFFRAAAGTNIGTLEIPYSDNILPWLEKYVLAHRKPFSVTTSEKGFVAELSELPDGLFSSKAAPKKSRKK